MDTAKPILGILDSPDQQVVAFLEEAGFGDDEVSLAAPSINDRHAQGPRRDHLALRWLGL